MHIHLHIVYGCFSATIADLNSCDLMAYEAEDTYHLAVYKKEVYRIMHYFISYSSQKKLCIIWVIY